MRLYLPKQLFQGFTLIELLVAISILAIVSVLAFVDYGPFKKDQVILTATNDIQNFIRTAQSNSTSGVLCAVDSESPDEYKTGASWAVEFTDGGKQMIMVCNTLGVFQANKSKVMSLKDNITYSLKCTDKSEPNDEDFVPCPSGFIANFSPIYGKVSFNYSNAGDHPNSYQFLSIGVEEAGVIKKSIILNTGGLVYVQ